jgi:hypothetical protein
MTERDADNARKLLTGAQVFAANSREGFITQYPTLRQFGAEEWNASLVIAGTGTALLMIPARYTHEQQKELTTTVITTLQEMDVAAVQTLADFINFVTSQTKDSEHVAEIIGSWVLRSIQMEPSEQSASHVLGLMLLNTFGPWWDQ